MDDEFWDQMEPALPFDDRLLLPNAPILIDQEEYPMAVDSQSRPVTLSGKLEQGWLPTPEVRFSGVIHGGNRHNPGLLAKEFQFSSDHLAFKGVIIRTAELASGLECSGFVQGPLRKGQEAAVDELRFSLVNFPSFLGLKVRHQVDDTCRQSLNSMIFRGDGWVLAIHQRFKVEDLLADVRARGGYVSTHSCSLKRRDGGQFSFAAAQEMLDMFTYFFAFLAGRWCGPVLPAGMIAAEIKWEIFGAYNLSTTLEGSSWFPRLCTLDAVDLLASFLTHWRSEVWHSPLRQVIHGIVSANTGQEAIQAGIAAAFVPLEMLSWVVLVEDLKKYTCKHFNDKLNNTGGKLSELLSACRIPDELPAHMCALRHILLEQENASDDQKQKASSALARIRNSIMHPHQTNRKFLGGFDALAKWQAKELCLQLVELVVLNRLGFNGRYRRRAFNQWSGHEYASVPWAQPQPTQS
jgi:hypothetical protein